MFTGRKIMLHRGACLLFGFVGMWFASGIATWMAYNLLVERTPEFKAPPNPLLCVFPLDSGFSPTACFAKDWRQRKRSEILMVASKNMT